MESKSIGIFRLIGGHVLAVIAAAMVFGGTLELWLANIDPSASHTDAVTARFGAIYVVLLYTAFVLSVHMLKRILSSRNTPMPASIHAWAVLVLPPAALAALMGIGIYH